MAERFKLGKEVTDALEIVDEKKWAINAVQDLIAIQDIISKSALPVIDEGVEERVSSATKRAINAIGELVDAGQEVTLEHYMFSLEHILASIRDDHTEIKHINLESYEMRFSQFMSSSVDKRFVIVYTLDSRIPIDGEVVSINGEPIEEYVKQFKSLFASGTDCEDLLYKKAAAGLSTLNPFLPVSHIGISENDKLKEVKLKYIIANDSLFEEFVSRGMKPSLLQAIKEIMYRGLNTNEELGVRLLRDADLLYFDLHGFPNLERQLFLVAEQIKLVAKHRWVVLDMRNNFGGSVLILNMLLHHMFGASITKALQKCTKYNFAVNKLFIDEYYKEIVLPILKSRTASDEIKEMFRDMMEEYHNYNGNVLTERNHPSPAVCNKDILSKACKKVSRELKEDPNHNHNYVVIITDSHCYSACIWTAKILLEFPNVVLIGKDVSHTQQSGNSLKFTLPSKKSVIYAPQLVAEVIDPSINNAVTENVVPDFRLCDATLNDETALLIYVLTKRHEILEAIKHKCNERLKNN